MSSQYIVYRGISLIDVDVCSHEALLGVACAGKQHGQGAPISVDGVINHKASVYAELKAEGKTGLRSP